MKEKIIVAGAGHGGIVAAYYLAKDGYDVTVYEKGEEGKLGHDQGDSIHLDGFEKSGIPIPKKWFVKRTPIAFRVIGTDIEPLVQADNENTYNVEIDRNALYEHLISLAVDAGAKFVYGCEVIAPIVLASRVVGIKTSMGDFYGGLVVDACGMYSPLRMQLPDSFGIQKKLKKYDVMSAYRAYYERVEGCEGPELRYQVSLVPGESSGLSWIVTNEDNVDILVGEFDGITEEVINERLEMYRKENPHMSNKLVRGGKVIDIPVRHPLSIMVADGYAAIGDSAFMTVPVKGSGIGYSMRAGKMLAECVINDKDGLLNRETLWQYQVDFYNEIGSPAAILAIAKNAFPSLSLELVEYTFREKILSSEDMAAFSNEQGLFKALLSLKISDLTGKAKKVVSNPEVRKFLTTLAKNVTKYLMIDRSFPNKYNSADIKKWAENYDNFFESIKYNNEENDSKTDKSEQKEKTVKKERTKRRSKAESEEAVTDDAQVVQSDKSEKQEKKTRSKRKNKAENGEADIDSSMTLEDKPVKKSRAKRKMDADKSEKTESSGE